MHYVVASWNIEKNGQSSTGIKQQKVSDFIDFCSSIPVHIIFLCEVHSSRVKDYASHLRNVYGLSYHVESLPGGHSNAYIVMIRKSLKADPMQDRLKGLNRGAIILQIDNDLLLTLAHFKSGQNGLTKDQLQNAAGFLDGAQPGRWAIIGDMNWDYRNKGALTVPGGAHASSCWPDMSQAKGGILDWCLAGGATQVEPLDCNSLLSDETKDMTGPDHRPVIFTLGPS
ncbi:endonuclease/exonuclease/phosphatase family protein [Acidocella sp.]|uniref:endonuclease/exonuclease/phosphatase family protein n=1 Tax=Acidocella sp. TaxID=50710 RepID=UPI003D03DD2B